MEFETNFLYDDRESKSRYVWLKYHPILRGRILDVGADQCYLRSHIQEESSYWGVGLGGNPDQQVDLENGRLPFNSSSFDCVLCLDVLEHLDNLHRIFDELCRVTRRFVIVSLPNPYADFFQLMYRGNYRPERALKFYGLPLERPQDRHKWFFSAREGRNFIRMRAFGNGMRIVQMDHEKKRSEGGFLRRTLFLAVHCLLWHRNVNLSDLRSGTLWAVLEKQGD